MDLAAPEKAQRTTTGPSATRRSDLDVPVVDGFRGLAVLWIVLGHCWKELGGKVPLDAGPLRDTFISSYMGVDMLFIVSGFVLFLPVVANGSLGDHKEYALRRAARILPAFYAAVVFSFLVSSLADRPHIGWTAWISHALFLHTEAHNVDKVGWGVNGALWTMSVEVMFYAALPLVAAWYRRRPFLGLLIAFTGAELWHAATLKLPSLLRWADVTWAGRDDAQMRMALAFPAYLGQFATGMTAAWLFLHLREHRDKFKAHALLAQAAALIGVLSIAYLRGWEGSHGLSGPFDHWILTADRTFFFGVLVLATALAASAAQWPLRNWCVRTLGIVCYGTYLSHLPLIVLLRPVLGFELGTTSNADLFKLAAIIVPLSVAVGWLSYRFLEEPFRRWARRTPRPVPVEVVRQPVALATSRA
jgi:acetyltransferase